MKANSRGSGSGWMVNMSDVVKVMVRVRVIQMPSTRNICAQNNGRYAYSPPSIILL